MHELLIVIANRMEIFREGLSRGLIDANPSIRVSQVSTCHKAIEACKSNKVDILIINAAERSPSSLHTLREVIKFSASTKVLLQFEDGAWEDGVRALSQGASGVIPLSATIGEYVTAVEALTKDHAFMPKLMVRKLVEMRPMASGTNNAYGLTSREIDVAILTAHLRSTNAVSKALGISKRTVETHRSAIYRKTSISKLSEFELLVQELDPGITELKWAQSFERSSKLRPKPLERHEDCKVPLIRPI